MVSDGSWQAGSSPLLHASLYDGKLYDASQEVPAWATADFATAGWRPVRTATGPRGTRIVLRHSKLLGTDGNLDPWPNLASKATDIFVLNGQGIETYEPRFTYPVEEAGTLPADFAATIGRSWPQP